MKLNDLFTPEEFEAELLRSAAEKPPVIPELIPYTAPLNRMGFSKDEFMNIMGTLAVVHRIIARKQIQ